MSVFLIWPFGAVLDPCGYAWAPLLAVSGGCSSSPGLPLPRSTGSRGTDLSAYSTQARESQQVGSRAGLLQYLSHAGLVLPRHVASSQTVDRTQRPLHWQVNSYPLRHQGSPP
ncbi:unnamed protein product [Rangifer tarandus platyrhynchus]|uniref:Uncharacterized protein n=1 Tax=Rangifer tarandus platyrhynchus TaxID=3082113 RepID=A0AC60A7I4_RANTA